MRGGVRGYLKASERGTPEVNWRMALGLNQAAVLAKSCLSAFSGCFAHWLHNDYVHISLLSFLVALVTPCLPGPFIDRKKCTHTEDHQISNQLYVEKDVPIWDSSWSRLLVVITGMRPRIALNQVASTIA